MSISEMKKDVQAIYAQADSGIKLPALVDSLCTVLAAHEEDIADITYSYRLCASDTGYVKAFSIDAGHFNPMTEMGEADVIVTGSEQNLLAVLRRDVSPMSALLRGKIKVNGSKAALIRFAEFL